jgi:hypothetical protein
MPSESLHGLAPGVRSALDYRVPGVDDATTFERMVAGGPGIVLIEPGVWSMPRTPSWGLAQNVEVWVLPGVQVVGGGQFPQPSNGNFVKFEVLGGVLAFAVRVMPPASQMIPPNTPTPISFGDPKATPNCYDTGGFWSALFPTRVTAPVTGIYHLSGSLGLQASAVGTVREMQVKLNGLDNPIRLLAENAPGGLLPWIANGGDDFSLNAGDFLQLVALHDAVLSTGLAAPLNNGALNAAQINRGVSSAIGLDTLSGSADAPALSVHYLGALPG